MPMRRCTPILTILLRLLNHISMQYFPKSLAPNLITFVGFLLTIVNFLLIGYYDYDFTASDKGSQSPVPNWVWITAAINIFVAYTLGKHYFIVFFLYWLSNKTRYDLSTTNRWWIIRQDGVDGKQARRTGTSRPLGELFDHGVDSYSAALIPIYVFSIFGRQELSTYHMFFILWNVFLNFFLTHFEKYNTGVMFLPWAYDFTMWVRKHSIYFFSPINRQLILKRLNNIYWTWLILFRVWPLRCWLPEFSELIFGNSHCRSISQRPERLSCFSTWAALSAVIHSSSIIFASKRAWWDAVGSYPWTRAF